MAHGKRHHLRTDAGFFDTDGRHGFRPRRLRLDLGKHGSRRRYAVRERDLHAHECDQLHNRRTHGAARGEQSPLVRESNKRLSALQPSHSESHLQHNRLREWGQFFSPCGYAGGDDDSCAGVSGWNLSDHHYPRHARCDQLWLPVRERHVDHYLFGNHGRAHSDHKGRIECK